MPPTQRCRGAALLAPGASDRPREAYAFARRLGAELHVPVALLLQEERQPRSR